MMRSGDYFRPVINGELYFDKPLLSYWAILPASWLAGGVSEWTTRLPSALAGVAAVLTIYALGRQLFGRSAGILAALLLATSAMFVRWSRGASADILNLLGVWLALWLWQAGGRQGRVRHLVTFYPLLAVGCFLKGPVAAALVMAVAGLASATEAVLVWRAGRWRAAALGGGLKSEFRWLASPGALLGMGLGAALFAALLLLPVALDGSWVSAELMWRENVTRFFQPFDHKGPVYLYVPQGLAYFAPWSLLLLAALWDARKRLDNRSERTAMCFAAGIFIFLTASGSRRDYYVLPLVPALALVTGRALAAWIESPDRGGTGARLALATTFALVVVAPLAAAVAVVKTGAMRQSGGLWVTAAVISVLAAGAIFLGHTLRRRLAVILALAWCAELLFFTAGEWLNERTKTFKPFMHRTAGQLAAVPDSRVAAYRLAHSRFCFYLNRGPIHVLHSATDVEAFRRREPHGYVFAKWKHADPKHRDPALAGMETVAVEEAESGRAQDNRIVLLRLVNGARSAGTPEERTCATCR